MIEIRGDKRGRGKWRKGFMHWVDDGSLSLNENQLHQMVFHQGTPVEKLVDSGDDRRQEWFYQFVLRFLTNIDFSEKEAFKHYTRILDHRQALSVKMGRDIGLRVAAFDYFFNVLTILKNPRIVELDLFEEIVKLAKEDPKTGCYNPHFLTEIILKEINRSTRYKLSFSLILIDIDNFKKFNDTYGHLFGDKILKDFSQIIQMSIRKEDCVARFGGDEFIIVLPHTGRLGARFVGERVRENFEKRFNEPDYAMQDIRVTFSAGIATYPQDASDCEGLIKSADLALYDSKKAGKNTITNYKENENHVFVILEDQRSH